MTACFLLRWYGLNGKPYGLNYIGRYSLCTCISKCIRLTFAQNVVGAVHIGANLASIFGAVQAISPPNPLPAKEVLFLIIGCVVGYRIKVKKTSLAGIALFPDFDLDTYERRFVGEHVNEACMRDRHKVLVVALAHAGFLLPSLVSAPAATQCHQRKQ